MVLAGGHPGLRGSKLEIEGLEHLFPDSARWKPDGGLQGLVAMSKKAKVLHVSGHAKGVSEQGGEIDLGPLRVSLAGLFSFQFEDGPLVVLATCEGGAGYDSKRGRSFSLITPFRAAGASRVMANIWALDDKEASVFFMEFYRLLKKDGATPEAALDKLRDRARLSGRHPYYWAGLFLIQGL